MKSISSLICSVLVLASLAYAEPIHWLSTRNIQVHHCSAGTDDYLHGASIEVLPHPIIVEEGRTIAVTSHFELAQAIEAGSKLKLKIVKKGLIPITIPCMDTAAGPVGSCEYELEPIVEASKLCPDYCPEGQLNQLPYGPGFYGGASIESVIGAIDPLVSPFLSGKMEITGRITNASGYETICFQFTMELKKP